VRFFGQDVTQRTTKERIEQGIGYMPQGGVLFPDLTIQENVQAYLGSHYNYDAMFDQLYHWPVSNAIKSGQLLRRMAALLGRHRTKARSLSGGEKQLVSIARTLLRPSRIILLDEPSIGLAPALLRELGTLLQDLAAARGTGMIIVDQNVPWVLGVSRYAYILQQGTVKAEGSSSEFLQNPEKLYAAFGLNAGSQ
jgi:branched-chain amino acid transport system ATP-binding protein